MTKYLMITILVLIQATGFSQTMGDIVFPNKSVIKKAKSEAENFMQTVQDSLDLSKRQIRIRNFELTPCDEIFEKLNKGLEQPADSIIKENIGKGIYSFQYKTNSKGSHHLISFFFDSNGEIINTEIVWYLVY
ncbi:hypothetical protein [Marinifilum caeruleilacunae]|uniref:DUF4783 domain-containing protein n=1 Tax=Marinifilum caeruleilacunae TaxID=2499076 RepID=A0ABX1WU15_9BACT|nr:hypothetical protein [Marinifilum caeruleilacunae]NOU59604.1 hypothetical protein [Marinifilum caeruleilacunae]